MAIQLTHKQTQAFDLWEDNITQEIVFGGGAGSAKSFLGCLCIVSNALKYKGTRWLIGRSKLKTLKETTLKTLWEVLKLQGLKRGVHYKFHETNNVITFFNGSEIMFKDLFYYPSDPEFDELGSLEITGAFVDEIAQIVSKAWSILKSRIRYRLDDFTPEGYETKDLEVAEYDDRGMPAKWYLPDGSVSGGLIPKILGTLNPAKNWVYKDFYLKAKAKLLGDKKAFIQALASDNKYVSKHYLESLNDLPKPQRDRLLLGIWESEDPDQLIEQNKMYELWTNHWLLKERQRDKYIIVDVARFGKDKAVIGYWEGMVLKRMYTFKRSSIEQLYKVIEAIRLKMKVPLYNILIDEDGVGGGLVDRGGYVGFVNNSAPVDKKNYLNLKNQCYFALADAVNRNEMLIVAEMDNQTIDEIIEELEQVKIDMDNTDNTKLRIIKKEVIKQNIGRSPDYSDMCAMRMFFELNPTKGVYHTSVA